jgi:hypothetical protein
MTSTSIQTAIAQAQAAADAVTPGQGQIVPFGRPISLMDNLVGSFAVDTWLKVKPYGMTIGKDTTTLFDQAGVPDRPLDRRLLPPGEVRQPGRVPHDL